MKRLNPLNDYLFLKMMGEKGNEKQCLAFLNAVLRAKGIRAAKLIKILENKTFTAEVIGEKTSILDVRVVTDTGEMINIEVQLRDYKNMEKRTLLHWGREYARSLSQGGDYAELARVITINIVNFDMINLDDFHTCFHLWEDSNKSYLLTDVMEIHFLNMVKFRKLKVKDVKNNPLVRWMTFFDIKTPPEKLEEVISMDKAISKANEVIEFVSQDKELLRLYQMRDLAVSDWNSAVNAAKKEGKTEVAKNLLREGLATEVIHRATGLDVKTIESLKIKRRQR